MKLIPALPITCCLMFFSAFAASAQFDSMAIKAPWLQYFFARMSPNTPEFSAVGKMDLCDTSGVVQIELPMDLAASTNGFRWEANVSEVWPLPPQAKAIAKQMRIDKMVFLIRNKEQKVYIVYPNLQAYVQVPIPAEALAQFDTQSQLIQFQKTPLGQEPINRHPCIKNKVIDTEPNLPPQSGVMWNATDLQEFPIKMELQVSQGIMRFNFQEVIPKNPGAWLFQIPANYTLFKNTADLLTYAKNQALTRSAE